MPYNLLIKLSIIVIVLLIILGTLTLLLEHKDHKLKMTDIKKQKELTHKIIENIPYPIHIIFIDVHEKIQYINIHFMKYIIGKHIKDGLWQYGECVEDALMVLRTKQPILNKEIEITGIGEDHEHYMASFLPINDDDRNILGVIGLLIDISDLEHARELFKIEKEEFQTMIESIDDSIYILDRNYNYKYVNANYLSKIGILNQYDILNKSYLKFHPKNVADDLVKRGNRVFNSGKSERYEFKDMHNFNDILRTINPIKNSDGKTILITVISRDITYLKAIEKELMIKNNELNDFTHTVTHDLKSPLITIKGFINMLHDDLKKLDLDGDIYMYINYIQTGAKKMDKFLTELLALSKAGHVLHENMNEIPFNDLVNESINQLLEKIKSNNIEIKVSPLPVVKVDSMRIIDVLTNLIENSIRYKGDMNKNPIIEIGYYKDNDKSVFFIKDNGIGIDKRDQKNVFNLFYRVDSDVEGTGVGLATVKKIIEAHGGKIWIESELGKGCTVYFML